MLVNAKEKYDLDIDVHEPTRGQRLEAALAMKDEANGFYSMEIMVGRRVSSSDPKDQALVFTLMIQGAHPSNPEKFYEGFAHGYWDK